MSENAKTPAYKDQRWVTGSGELSGNPALVRKNVSVARVDTTKAPYLVLVTLLYKALGPDGLPSDDEELVRLDETEDRIADAMAIQYKAHFVLAVTSGGARDLFFFHADATTDTQADVVVQVTQPAVDYELSLVHDPLWRPYREILPEAVDGAVS